jgi:undecaprenyl-diphosphatase
MTPFQAFILGLLQGLAEFLPISSSAHLTLAPWLLGWKDPGLSFDVALHFGTLVAVLWYFRAEWNRLGRAAVAVARQRGRMLTPDQWELGLLVVATIPGGLAGVALESKADEAFRAPALVAGALIAMGIILWAVDRWAAAGRTIRGLTWRDAIAIGIAQAFALVPGVSRSGATITAGRALRLNRDSAAVFSFLMSMPIIAAAALLKLPHVVREGITLPLVIGVVTAAVSGWVAIAIVLRYVKSHSYGVFAIYRVVAGLAVLAVVVHRASHG